jgi:hypothetical protein
MTIRREIAFQKMFRVSGFEFRVSSVRIILPDYTKHETRHSQLYSPARRIRDCSRSVHEYCGLEPSACIPAWGSLPSSIWALV